ncbi:B-cell lymphoma 3 protein-like [Tachypleus tridentatus]|uniref:B-cell lymphoma 3 protein-like n=1 Tax=Tachypleus tridentatus TaxID=6853 RepID=UPI003FD178BD
MNSTSESSLNRYLTLGTPCNHGQYFPRLKTMKNSSSQDYEFASLLVKGHVTTYFKVGGHIHKDTMVKDKSSCELQKPMDKNKFGQAVETLHSNSCSDRTLKLSREQYVVLMKNRFSVEEPKNFDILYCMKADEDGDRPLHIATIHEDVSLVKHLCSLMKRIGASVHIYNYLQQTPLHLAIVVGNQHIVEILLEEGACPKSQDRYGNTSLHLAVKYNRLECLHILLKYKQVQDIRNLRNYDGYSALHLAVTNNSSTSIKYLVKACCDIDVKDGKSGRTPLFHAVMNNNKPLIKLLLKLGGSTDAPDFSGVSPLQASLLNNKDIALLMGSRKLRTYSRKISACGKENVIRKQRKIIK